MSQKNSFFNLKINGRILDLSSPCVMSIINVTPDSFWSGSRKTSDHEIAQSVAKAIEDGAAILDIGGYSTRPGANEVREEEEIERVLSALRVIRAAHGDLITPISIDTFRSSVVERVVDEWGEVIVNDISAGDDDARMLPTVGKYRLPYVAMHKKGTPKTMTSLTTYDGDIVESIITYFVSKIEEIRGHGIDDLILDVGFGFAKDMQQNFTLMQRYNEFAVMGLPTLVGISRKRMIWQTLNIDVADALNGTSALHWQLLNEGASILRVHDTKEASEVIKLHKFVMNGLS